MLLPSQEGQEELAPQFWARRSNGKVDSLESLMGTQAQLGVLCPFKGSVLLRQRVYSVCLALLSNTLVLSSCPADCHVFAENMWD